jgi:TetR/AcrR family transcriptional repressor of nem operon
LDVAQALVQTVGANAMSYQQISEAVGIRKASIHHHFPTKADLIEALVERYSQCFFELVDRILNSRHTGRQKLREYIALFEGTLREGAQDKACAMGMLGAEARTLGPVALDRVKLFFSQNEQRVAMILEEGRRDGSLSFEGSSTAMASLIFSLLEGEMLVARGRANADHFRVVADQLLRMLKA